MGLTSSDILDTSMSVLLKEAGGILLKDLDRLLNAIKSRALEHENTINAFFLNGKIEKMQNCGKSMAGCRERIKDVVLEQRTNEFCGSMIGARFTQIFFHLNKQ